MFYKSIVYQWFYFHLFETCFHLTSLLYEFRNFQMSFRNIAAVDAHGCVFTLSLSYTLLNNV